MMEGVCALLLLILLHPAAGDLNAGFMRDFFTRFPHFPAFSMFQVSSEIQNLGKKNKYFNIKKYGCYLSQESSKINCF
jgi:hypothetical protein